MCKNYVSILQANNETRNEGLKSYQLIENYTREPYHPGEAYVSYESDLMILDIGGVWSGWRFRNFTRFTDVVPARECAQLQRLVVPLPKRSTRVPYREDIRKLENLRELCFFSGTCFGPDFSVHKCELYPSGAGNPAVLVDITGYWSVDEMRKHAGNFIVLQKEFAEVKESNPDWKLEKLRLVTWAKNE